MSGSLHDSPDPPHLKSLAVEIHAATRAHHTSLNRLITSRLPLCLPPHTHNASAYYHGISAFADIFFAFEQAWSSILTTSTPSSTDPALSRTQTILRPLHLPRLLRTNRLRHDLSVLLGPQHHQQQQPNRGRVRYLTSLTASIHPRIHNRPHLLLAYTRTMYLALFNGGHWIRAQLLSASSSTDTTATTPFWPDGQGVEACLTFWHFDGNDDGEDVKHDFKSRFDEMSELLTEKERVEVVDEAVEILRLCERMVGGLDRLFQDCSRAGEEGKEEEEKREEGGKRGETLENPALPARVSLTSRLYDLLVWMWMLFLGGMQKAGNAVPARHGVVMKRAELKTE